MLLDASLTLRCCFCCRELSLPAPYLPSGISPDTWRLQVAKWQEQHELWSPTEPGLIHSLAGQSWTPYLASQGLSCLVYKGLAWQWGEGNGTPLQYSCLENPMDRGAWWAAICGVAQSRTRLKRLSSSSMAVKVKADGYKDSINIPRGQLPTSVNF